MTKGLHEWNNYQSILFGQHLQGFHFISATTEKKIAEQLSNKENRTHNP
jgi:hypothetical protein